MMRAVRWMFMVAVLHGLASSPAWAGDQHCRRWWGVGFGDGYHVGYRCCGPQAVPYGWAPQYVPVMPLPAEPAGSLPESLGPSARDQDPQFSPWARLPRRGGPRISR